MTRDYLHLSVNGQLHKVSGRDAFLPLSDFLRYQQSLTGTKVVCAEGDCGACTVMFRRPTDTDRFKSLNSCISTLMLLDGCHLISVEALKRDGNLSEIQDSMVRNFGGQCGFCTPGFVMSIANLYEQTSGSDQKVDEQKVKNYLTGNLCRCTGYSPIIAAALDVDAKKIRPLKEKYEFEPLDEELRKDREVPILIRWKDKEFYAPATLEQAAKYKKENPGVRIFSGATDIGVQINKGKDPGSRWMSFHLLNDLYKLREDAGWIHVGARVSLSDLQVFLEDRAPEFSKFLNIFASPQIKNAATLIGNIANGSPIADTTPYLMTADAEVNLFSTRGKRSLPLEDFITGYKKFNIEPDEFITSIRFKVLDKGTKVGLYKISQRRDLDISCVNSSFVFLTEGEKVKSARISYGGVGPKTMRLTDVEKGLIGKTFDANLVQSTKRLIGESITPISDARGTSEFRSKISQDMFEMYFEEHF